MKRNSTIKFPLIFVLAYALLGCSRQDFEPEELTVETSTAAVGPFVPFGDPDNFIEAIIGSPMVTLMKSPSILYTPEDTTAPFKLWYERPSDGNQFIDIRNNLLAALLGIDIFTGSVPSSIGLATSTSVLGEDQTEPFQPRYTDQGIVLDGANEGCDLNDPEVIPIETSNGTALLMFLTMICDETTPQIHLCIDETGNGDSWSCVDGDPSSTSTTDPIIPVGSGDDCDAGGAYAPSVIRDGNTLRMVYSGWDGNEDYCLLYAEATIEDAVELDSQSFTTASGWTKGGTFLTQSNEIGAFDEGFVGHPSFVKETTELGEPICKIYYTGCTGGISPVQTLEDYLHLGFYDCSIGFAGTFQSDCKSEYQRRADIIIPTLFDTLTFDAEELIADFLTLLFQSWTDEQVEACDEAVTDFIATIAATNNQITIENCEDLLQAFSDLLASLVGGQLNSFHFDDLAPDIITVDGSSYLFYRLEISILFNQENTAGINIPLGIMVAKFTP
ncbi:MAG: hypothetical protein HY538_06050 [Deltaproteobacteria bacterium]|nr:hypothetical protein [Deltaproteobacteria bacterium]